MVDVRRATGTADFYPRSPCGERPVQSADNIRHGVFLSTLSLRRATSSAAFLSYSVVSFLSTLSLRRATIRYTYTTTISLISIHALLAESDSAYESDSRVIDISIHALLAESDASPNSPLYPVEISIHALLAESDSAAPLARREAWPFLSTLSLRRATIHGEKQCWPRVISIHALLAESDQRPMIFFATAPKISIHALLAESDRVRKTAKSGITISIHALLAESDGAEPARVGFFADFYPRSPCGERLTARRAVPTLQPFLSTLSLRRATMVHYS